MAGLEARSEMPLNRIDQLVAALAEAKKDSEGGKSTLPDHPGSTPTIPRDLRALADRNEDADSGEGEDV